MKIGTAVILGGLLSWALLGCGDDDDSATPNGSGATAGAGGSSGAAGNGGSTGGSGTGASSGNGGSSNGGSTTGGTGGSSNGDGEYFSYDATIANESISGHCVRSDDTFAETTLGVTQAGNQVNVGCPGATATYVTAGGCGVSFTRIDLLAAGAFSFNQSNDEIDIGCKLPDPNAQGLQLALIFAKSVTVSGTWDPDTKTIEGTFAGEWEDGGQYKPAGTTSGSFRAITPLEGVPEANPLS